jgi:hypothetical protein
MSAFGFLIGAVVPGGVDSLYDPNTWIKLTKYEKHQLKGDLDVATRYLFPKRLLGAGGVSLFLGGVGVTLIGAFTLQPVAFGAGLALLGAGWGAMRPMRKAVGKGANIDAMLSSNHRPPKSPYLADRKTLTPG